MGGKLQKGKGGNSFSCVAENDLESIHSLILM